MFRDLREWIGEAEKIGKVLHIKGAHWDREIGALSEIVLAKKRFETPLILFEEIPGFTKDYRVSFHELVSPWAVGLTLGVPMKFNSLVDMVKIVYERMENIKPIPMKVVKSGPILENVQRGKEVNLLKFPVLRFSEFDGGRYIGTSDCVIMRDPEEGWVNVGTYRMQLQDERAANLFISPGKHGGLIRQKYFEQGKPCPVAVTLGQDPLLLLCAGNEFSYGTCEFDYAGGVRGEAIEVIEGPETGLPIPANAEIAIEGYCTPGDNAPEGPFPEWPGTYGSSSRGEPVMRVATVLHRNQPILTARHAIRGKTFDFKGLIRSALLWREIEQAGVRDVRGVWRYEQGGSRFFNVVSIKQRYYGHARQALHVAAQTSAGAYAGRWVIVVDDDIDPSNIDEVLWAMSSRCNPATDIEFINRARSTPLDPMCFDKTKNFYTSLALVDACIPYEERENYPRAIGAPAGYRQEILQKWQHLLEKV